MLWFGPQVYEPPVLYPDSGSSGNNDSIYTGGTSFDPPPPSSSSGGGFQVSDIGKFFNDLFGTTTNNEFSSDEASKQRAWQEMLNALNNKFNADQAAISREWQEEMRNSAYSSAVMDMKKAGLNPAALSASGSGMNLASTPGGMAATSGNAPGGAAAHAGAGNNWLGLVGDIIKTVSLQKIAQAGKASKTAGEAVKAIDEEKQRAFRAMEEIAEDEPEVSDEELNDVLTQLYGAERVKQNRGGF